MLRLSYLIALLAGVSYVSATCNMVDLYGYYGAPGSISGTSGTVTQNSLLVAAFTSDTTQTSSGQLTESTQYTCNANQVYLRFSPETVGNALTITINGVVMNTAGSLSPATAPTFGGATVGTVGPTYVKIANSNPAAWATSPVFNNACDSAHVAADSSWYSCGSGQYAFSDDCQATCVNPSGGPQGPIYEIGPLPSGVWNCPGAATTVGGPTSSAKLNPANTATTSQNTIVFGDTLYHPQYSNNLCSQTDTYVIKRTQTAVVGDPQFVGLRGQNYQVHGIDGGVYALISSPSLTLNSKFSYLSGSHPCPIIPSTGKKSVACFQHAGSYLQNLALLTVDGARVLIESGSAKKGLSAVQVNGQDLQVGDFAQLNNAGGWVSYNSTHEVTFQSGPFTIEVENSDLFLNLRQVSVPSSSWKELKADNVHGLLGQTWRLHKNKTVIEGRVDDYLLESGDMFDTVFMYSRYPAESQ